MPYRPAPTAFPAALRSFSPFRHSQGATGARQPTAKLLTALAVPWAWASPGELLGVGIQAGRTDSSVGHLGLTGSLGGEKPVFIKR